GRRPTGAYLAALLRRCPVPKLGCDADTQKRILNTFVPFKAAYPEVMRAAIARVIVEGEINSTRGQNDDYDSKLYVLNRYLFKVRFTGEWPLDSPWPVHVGKDGSLDLSPLSDESGEL